MPPQFCSMIWLAHENCIPIGIDFVCFSPAHIAGIAIKKELQLKYWLSSGDLVLFNDETQSMSTSPDDLDETRPHIENAGHDIVKEPLLKRSNECPHDLDSLSSPGMERFLKRRLHAKGGLGEVSLAVDRELKRDVALKEIQSRFSSDENAKRRFIFEAEVTGRLEHPGIVPVYAFGSYCDGRPYYAMKFVNGRDLQQECLELHARGALDFESSDFRRLLHRFIDVCEAISYAHSRGILHRDIKPGNIMLGDFGETLVVDWGLAKPISGTSQEDRSETHLWFPSEAGSTLHGQIVGTPTFMSPEQASGDMESLDARSDIYSLGATLHFMLTGAPPYSGSLLDVVERVKQSDFLPPKQVDSRVPKSLDAIVAKAMRKHPEDRYETASAMAKDVEAFLADDPLQALSDTWSDRVARFQRKNRKAVLVGSLAALCFAVAATVAATLIQYQSNINRTLAMREKEAKEAAERLALEKTILAESESEAKRLAETRLSQVEKSNELILSIFRDMNPDTEDDTPIRALLADKLVKVSEQLVHVDVGEPLRRAQMQATLARSILRLGDPQSAITIAADARASFVALRNENTAEALGNRLNLGLAYLEAGRTLDALAELSETVSMAKQIGGPESDLLFNALTANGVAHSQAGEGQWALVYHESALRLAREIFGDSDQRTIGAQLNVGSLLYKQNCFEESLPLVEQAARKYKDLLGPSHTRTLKALEHLQQVYLMTGRTLQAVESAREVLRLYQLKFGTKHPDTVAATLALANVLCNFDAEPEAIELLQGAIAQCTAEHGSDSRLTLQLQGQLAFSLYCRKNLPEALKVSEQTLKSMRDTLGHNHRDTIVAARVQGQILLAMGQRTAAIAVWKETLDAGRVSPGTKASEVLELMLLYADALSAEGAREDAIEAYLELRDARRNRFGPKDEMSYGILTRIAWNLIGVGRKEEVVPLLDEYVDYRRTTMQDQLHLLASELQYVGVILNEAQRWNASEPILREALAMYEDSTQTTWKSHFTRFHLGLSIAMQNRMEEGEPLIRKGIAEWITAARNVAPLSDQEREMKEALPDLLRHLISCETALGKEENAAAWKSALPEWLEWSTGKRKKPPEPPVSEIQDLSQDPTH